MKPLIFVTFRVIVNYIFPKNLIEIYLVVQKMERCSPTVLTIFVNVLDFPSFPRQHVRDNVSSFLALTYF